MSEESEQMEREGGLPLKPISNRRIVVLMCAISVAGSLTGLVLSGASFALGVLIGGAMSAVGFLWLKSSLGTMFERAVAGEPVQFQAVKFLLRYLAMGAVLYAVYLSGALPITAVLLGLASFAGAVIVEGISRAVSGFKTGRED